MQGVFVRAARRAKLGESADARDIERTLAGESEAYRRLIERHQQHVSRILWKFTRDKLVHEELVEDVFGALCHLVAREVKGK